MYLRVNVLSSIGMNVRYPVPSQSCMRERAQKYIGYWVSGNDIYMKG